MNNLVDRLLLGEDGYLQVKNSRFYSQLPPFFGFVNLSCYIYTDYIDGGIAVLSGEQVMEGNIFHSQYP